MLNREMQTASYEANRHGSEKTNAEKKETVVLMNLMDPNNLGDLSPILVKLLEVIQQGVGAPFRSYFIRRNAQAESDAMLLKARTLAEIKQLLPGSQIGYEADGLVITTEGASLGDGMNEMNLLQRAKVRQIYEEIVEQENIEQITTYAAQNLANEQEVSEKPVDPGWSKRFFKMARDISKEEMQMLWGRVLAGEIKRPNTYSLRTLEVLKNLSQYEAEIIERAANLTLSSGPTRFLYTLDGVGNYLASLGLTMNEQLILHELGIIYPTPLQLTVHVRETGPTAFLYGDYSILVFIKGQMALPELRISNYAYTIIGHEMLTLLEVKPNLSYLRTFIERIMMAGFLVKYSKFQRLENGDILPFGLKDIPPFPD